MNHFEFGRPATMRFMPEQPSWLKLDGPHCWTPQSLLADFLDSHDPLVWLKSVHFGHNKSPLAYSHKIFSVLMPKIQHNYRR